jgi:threonylcarbamoyladenosine tRNA methylthiotransferase MtaB
MSPTSTSIPADFLSAVPAAPQTIVADETTSLEMSDSTASQLQTVAFHTLGCRANQLETTTLAEDFKERGWVIGAFDEPADVYVLNTCTVTERADQESRRMIRRARLSNPQARIAVTGCYAQVAPEELAAQEGVHLVVGNHHKDELPALVASLPPHLPQDGLTIPVIKVSEIDKSRLMVGASAAAIDRTRGSLKIQDGCDYKCTYCIIWQARGPSRSLSVEDVKSHLGRMIFDGFKEIMLTGINIGQYEHDGADLADLLQALTDLPGAFRLRLTSLDPLEVTDKLIDAVANSNGKICPYFHLSAQSAEDSVLKRMGRRHHVAGMQATCQAILKQLPNACIGADLIVGFPGESLERFEATVAALDASPIHYLHVFSYSARSNTPAADFEDSVPEREKRRRAQVLRDWSDKRQLIFRQQFIDQTLDILMEDGVDDLSRPKGLSENYIKITLTNATLLPRQEFDLPSLAHAIPTTVKQTLLAPNITMQGDKTVRPNDRVRVRLSSVNQNECLGELL